MFATSPIPDLKRSIDAIGMAVFVVDVRDDGFAIAALNRCHERLTGLDHRQVSGRLLAEWLPPDIVRTLEDNYRRCLHRGGEIEYEEELDLPGGWRCWHTVLAPLTDPAGRIVRILGTSTDITERKTAQAALRASEERLRAVLAGTPDCVVMINAEGGLLYANPAMLEALEMAPERTQGCNCGELGLSEHDMAPIVQDRKAVFRDGRPRRGETRIDLPRGERDFEYLISPIRDEQDGIEAVVMVLRDISERKRVERLKDQFLATVSHELRTPLTSIRGSLGLLAGGTSEVLSPRATTLVGIARKNCERLILLVNDILDMEKLRAGQMYMALKPQSLKAILEDALEAQRDYARQFRVTLQLEPTQDCQVNVDDHRLLQVLANLLSNAAKFSPPDSMVVCTLAHRDGRVRVSVRDQGPGIPVAFHERIFERFSQFDSSDARAREGTGLGLAIARSLMEAMGGRLDFDRRRRDGATFFFELPEWQPTAETLHHGPDHHPRILHVENDLDLRRVVATIARPLARFVSAATFHEARQLLSEGDFDLVLLDLTLPDGHGHQVLELLGRRQTAPPVVLFTSGPVPPETARRAARVLIKSRTTDQQLLDTLKNYLNTGGKDDGRGAPAASPALMLPLIKKTQYIEILPDE